MKKRKIIYVDVGKMSSRKLCEQLDIEYIPWYKSSLFWGLVLTFSVPYIMTLINLLQGKL